MLRARIRSWLRMLHRSSVERELDQELRFHLEAYTEDLVRGGMQRREAERQARLEFGGIAKTKESCRQARGTDLVESLGADIAYGARLLRRTPGFTALAVLIMALGIGATTAVFNVVNAVLLRQLPYHDPERLVYLYEPLKGVPNVPLEAWSPVNGDFFEGQRQSQSFDGMAMFTTDRFNVSMGEDAFRTNGSRVTGNFFGLLGVGPVLGRAIENTDTQPGKGRVVVISDALWRARFGSDRGVLGKEL